MVSEQGLQSLLTKISLQNTKKWKHPPETPKTRNGLIQILRMDMDLSERRIEYCSFYCFCPKMNGYTSMFFCRLLWRETTFASLDHKVFPTWSKFFPIKVDPHEEHRQDPDLLIPLEQGSYVSGKCQGNLKFFKDRELSRNFIICQGKSNFC